MGQDREEIRVGRDSSVAKLLQNDVEVEVCWEHTLPLSICIGAYGNAPYARIRTILKKGALGTHPTKIFQRIEIALILPGAFFVNRHSFDDGPFDMDVLIKKDEIRVFSDFNAAFRFR